MELSPTALFSFSTILFLILLPLSIVLMFCFKRRLILFIHRGSNKDKYGYLREWTNLNEGLGTILDEKELIIEIKKIVKQGLKVNSVELVLDNPDTELMQWLFRYGEAISVKELSRVLPKQFEENRQFLQRLDAHIIVAVYAKHTLLGLLAVGKKTNRRAFFNEDKQLLKIISRQIAIAILNARSSQESAVSQEMEQVGKLSSFLIHDLNNLISTLSTVIHNASINFDNQNFRKDSLSTISGTITKMNSLIGRLSTLPNKLELVPRPTNINVIIEEAIARTGIDDNPRIRLLRLFEYVPQLSLDAECFQKAIQSLVFNAMDSMPNGGTLTIKTSYHQGIGASNDSYVQITIKDTGCGMSGEFIQQRLFKPFQSNKHKGLGISLFQCKNIVQAHGGEIQVESQEGKGSAFLLRLPVRRIEQELKETVPKKARG